MTAGGPYRVAYVIGELGQGGAEYQLHELLRLLDRERFRPEVFALAPGGHWTEPIRRLEVPVFETARRRSLDPSRLRALRRALRAFTPHLLHTILWSANCYGRLAALGLGIPVRIAAERNAIHRPSWQVWLERALDRATDAYLVNCGAVADVLVRHERLPREKMRVVPNGIDLGRLPPFSLDRRAARTALGFAPERRLVAQVGRLAPQKDHPTFLRAAAAVAAAAPDVDFLIVGAGPERAVLEELAGGLGLGGRVRFTGSRLDVPALLGAVDVLTLTSIFEGFPNVVLEAMATGAVAVASDVGGCAELVVAGETGLLVPARAPAEVAAAVLRVLGDPALAHGLALAARRRVERDFSVEAMVHGTAAVYLGLLGAEGTGAKAVAAA
jgi:glycosyltransferase involved in cell wall biosynthesis